MRPFDVRRTSGSAGGLHWAASSLFALAPSSGHRTCISVTVPTAMRAAATPKPKRRDGRPQEADGSAGDELGRPINSAERAVAGRERSLVDHPGGDGRLQCLLHGDIEPGDGGDARQGRPRCRRRQRRRCYESGGEHPEYVADDQNGTERRADPPTRRPDKK